MGVLIKTNVDYVSELLFKESLKLRKCFVFISDCDILITKLDYVTFFQRHILNIYV